MKINENHAPPLGGRKNAGKRKTKERKKAKRKSRKKVHLAESVSKSGAGDAGTYDDYVYVVTFGSAFSICRGGALHALASLHR